MFESESKLQPDGTLSGPKRSKSGREIYECSLFITHEDLADPNCGFLVEVNVKRVFLAFNKIAEDSNTPNWAWNVHTQSVSFTHEGMDGILYTTLAEIDT